MNLSCDSSFEPTPAPMATSDEVARWMLLQIEKHRVLYQDDAAAGIARTFGEAFICKNENGKATIRRDVLSAFRILTEDLVVLDRQSRLWRKRDLCDDPGPKFC
jgi:hypothetical protein